MDEKEPYPLRVFLYLYLLDCYFLEHEEPIYAKLQSKIINGNKIVQTKKSCNVGLSTEYPPHNQVTILSPTNGIALNKLVITK